jgi:WD40-like Beta Propeller Repeat
MSRARTALIATLALALAPQAARADVFAASEGFLGGRADLDILLVNASTGAEVTLPAGLNTTGADELHPSLSADGSKMVFERRSGATVRIVETDLRTGQSADLFNGFEQAANPQVTPSISRDGRTVVTGEAFGADAKPQVTLTDVSAFPAGPFPHSTYRTSFSFAPGTTGATENPVLSGNLIAFEEQPTGADQHIVVGQLGGGTSQPFGSRHPALGAPGGVNTVLFDVPGGNLSRDLAFSTFTDPTSAAGATVTPLAQLNTSSSAENRPSFSPDGRYVAFVGRNVRLRGLLVWDSQTQTTINAPGASLGAVDTPIDGATSIFVRPLLKSTGIVGSQIRFDLLENSGIGILVQRVTGHHKLFGKTVPTLRPVGKVPLGRFRKGSGHVRWDGKVAGKRLRHGTYQVTVRAVTRRGKVRDLGKPKLLKR